MTAIKHTWHAWCTQLGVNPKQFAMLGGVMLAAFALLTLKIAGPVKPARAAISKPAPVAAAPAPARPRAIEFALEEHPSGNPFAALNWRASPQAAHASPANAAAAGSTAPGLRLTATLSGELAVVDGHSVRRGDLIVDTSSGQSWILREIGLRHIELESDGVVARIPLDG